MSNQRIAISVFFSVFLFLSSVGFCQTDDEGLAFLQLNFFNPGARALAMGGAFIAMADDATAAVANPAGLTTLIKPEMSLEFSAARYRNEIPWDSGYYDYQLIENDHQRIFFDFSPHFEPKDFPSSLNGISFGSFVYPVIKDRFVFSGFFNEQTNFKRSFETEFFYECLDECITIFLTPTRNSLDLSIRDIGISTGFKPSRFVSLGATVNFSKLNLNSSTARFDPETNETGVETTLFGDDNRVGYTIGALIVPEARLSVGFVYSKRPAYHVTATLYWPDLGPDQHRSEILRVPDSLGVGINLKPTDRLSINVDAVRIRYSQLMRGYYNAYSIPETRYPDPVFLDRRWGKTGLEVSDGTEYRVGAEYIFFKRNIPIAIRGGYWREPFHGLAYRLDDVDIAQIESNLVDVDGRPTPTQRNEVIFTPFFSRSFRHDNHHVTFGSGIVLKSFTIDWAFDYSKNFKRLLLSTVVYLESLAAK